MVRKHLDGLMVFAISEQNRHSGRRPQCDKVAFYCMSNAVVGTEQDLEGPSSLYAGLNTFSWLENPPVDRISTRLTDGSHVPGL